MKTKAVLLSSISGVLLFLSFPKFGSPWCVWIALVPLFYALNDSETSFEALFCGFLTGFIFNIGIIYWVIHVVVVYGAIPLYIAFLIMLLFAAYLALHVSLFASGAVFLKKHGIDIFISAPFIWTSLEFVKAYFLTGLPWEGLAYSQWSILPVIQIAEITQEVTNHDEKTVSEAQAEKYLMYGTLLQLRSAQYVGSNILHQSPQNGHN